MILILAAIISFLVSFIGTVYFYQLAQYLYYNIWFLKNWTPEKHFYLKYIKKVEWLQGDINIENLLKKEVK